MRKKHTFRQNNTSFEMPASVVRDAAKVASKRARLAARGRRGLLPCIVADFDYTLSAFRVTNERGEKVKSCSTHRVIETFSGLAENYRVTAKKLQEFYYPLEIDTSLSHEQRDAHMLDWVTKAHDALTQHSGLCRDDISKAVAEATVKLRDGASRLLRTSERNGVKLIIFSAGIDDVLREILTQRQEPFSHALVESNKMVFDDDSGALVGFGSSVYFTGNKTATVAIEKIQEYLGCSGTTSSYPDLIVVGDSIGDLKMSQGLECSDRADQIILTVGLLNDRVEERLPEFLEKFDVVIAGDGSLDYVNELLDEILAL